VRNARFLDLPPTHPDVIALREELERMKRTAASEALDHVRQLKDRLGSWRFAPSRLRKCPRDRELLASCFRTYYQPAIAKRLPELIRLDRKLWRICSEWPLSTRTQLSEIPDTVIVAIKEEGTTTWRA
jgi:hypothetical protein